MKTLFIHNALPEYRIDFMQKLSRLCEVDFLITDIAKASQIYGIEVDDKLEGLKIFSSGDENNIAFLKTVLKDGGYSTVVLPPADSVGLFLLGLFALRYSSKRGIKTIYWTEKWEADRSLQPWMKRIKNAVQRLMIRWLAGKCDVCIASGSRAKEYYIRSGIDESKIIIAYDSSTSPMQNTVPHLREQFGVAEKDKVILYLGRLVKRKGCDLLIEAYKNIARKRNDVWLLIGGTGEGAYERRCRILAEGSDHIRFLGLIQPQVRGSYYRSADVFVLPSYSLGGVIEAWGMTVNEALECGTPVIATTAVGAAYDLLDGKNGTMVAENDVLQLAEGIEMILSADKTVVTDACTAVAARFSTQNMANAFYRAIASLER